MQCLDITGFLLMPLSLGRGYCFPFSSMIFFTDGEKSISEDKMEQVAQRGGGAPSLQTAKVRLDGL